MSKKDAIRWVIAHLQAVISERLDEIKDSDQAKLLGLDQLDDLHVRAGCRAILALLMVNGQLQDALSVLVDDTEKTDGE